MVACVTLFAKLKQSLSSNPVEAELSFILHFSSNPNTHPSMEVHFLAAAQLCMKIEYIEGIVSIS